MRAAALHDIGKIDIPCRILTKPGRLTRDEYSIIKTHPVLGYDRPVNMGEDDALILAVVRSHHKRVDGSGYSDGLVANAIHPTARCFAVVDTFDSLTSIRPYRQAIGPQAAKRALAELNRHAGSWYCPEVIDSLTSLYETGKLDWIMHHYNEMPRRPRVTWKSVYPVLTSAGV